MILHVGWPKTATTSMQADLSRYPNLAGKPFGHAETAHAVPTIDGIVRSREWTPNELNALIERSRHVAALPVLLSDEMLIAMPQREWFENLVGPFEVADRLAKVEADKGVFFTLRDPRRQLRSTWLHHVREGRTQSYPQFLDRVAHDRFRGQGTFAIAALVERYVELFGRDRLVVGFTEDYTADPLDFWRRFGDVFAITGMDGFVDCTGPRLNETILGPISFELTVNRVLRAYSAVRRRDDIRPVRRRVTRNVSRRIAANHDSFFARHLGVENVLVDELRADIEQMRATIRSM